MKKKFVTPTGQETVLEIAEKIALDNPNAADRYTREVESAFFEWPDNAVPRRASERLPKNVRVLSVKGFKGYTLHIATFDDAIYLIAAYAPGLSETSKRKRAHRGLKEI